MTDKPIDAGTPDGPRAKQDRLTDVLASTVPPPTKTPLYQAMHAARYQRQAIINEIQGQTGRQLICYVGGPATSIDRDDTVGFVDLLHNTPANSNLDLLLHTGGGDIDAAEKLITMVRNRVSTGVLRVVVPDFAKSAGTLMAVGADDIVMSETSELGPIDPQVIRSDGSGHSIQSYLDAYEAHSQALRRDPSDAAARLMLNKLDPAIVKQFEAIRERARSFAESQLKSGMFRSKPGNFTKIASELLDTKKWLTHGQMIGAQDAQSMGLSIQYLEATSVEWQRFWQLYCLQRLAVTDRQKLFESAYASLVLDSRA